LAKPAPQPCGGGPHAIAGQALSVIEFVPCSGSAEGFMSAYASVTAVLAGADGDAAILAAAARLAGSSGRVRAIAVRSDPVRVLPMVGEAGAAAATELMAVLEQQSKERSARAHASFESWRGQAGQAAVEFQDVLGHPAETASLAARNSDIVVVARPRNEDEPMAASLVEACLFGSGRPVLVVPARATAFGAAVAVLWDGSRTGARAVGDALPLLSKARSVLVLTSGEIEEELPTGEAVAARLTAQGILASARALQRGGSDAATLAAAVSQAGCDLIVMGGYAHSRVREMILGGVTRHMLSSSPVPILMAH
jgi:nucleotide-binding universal stress UspA family protein